MWCMKSRFFVLLPSRGEVLRVSPRPRLVGGREGSEGPGGGLGGENSLAGRPPPTRHWLCSPSWGLASAGAARRHPHPTPHPPSRLRDGSVCSRATEGPQEVAGPGWAGGRSGLGAGRAAEGRLARRGAAGEGTSRDPVGLTLSRPCFPPPPPAGAHSAFIPPTALPPWSAT